MHSTVKASCRARILRQQLKQVKACLPDSLVFLRQHVLQVCEVPETADDLRCGPVVLRKVCACADLWANMHRHTALSGYLSNASRAACIMVAVHEVKAVWHLLGFAIAGVKSSCHVTQ